MYNETTCTGISECCFWKTVNKLVVNQKLYTLMKLKKVLSTRRWAL